MNILRRVFARNIEIVLEKMIRKAAALGLPEKDLAEARMFLEHIEWGLCFDTLVDGLHEDVIPIDTDFLELAKNAISVMKLDPAEYEFLNELAQLKL